MNKTEKRVIINEQNNADKTNTICLMINTNVLIIVLYPKEWDLD